ncbi:hypothetical protein B0H12DRAFT_1075412 [Mycena haematopus]|nr:hypothetical protein B0H12DRAFT_1075412 [Mycena haematopus]
MQTQCHTHHFGFVEGDRGGQLNVMPFVNFSVFSYNIGGKGGSGIDVDSSIAGWRRPTHPKEPGGRIHAPGMPRWTCPRWVDAPTAGGRSAGCIHGLNENGWVHPALVDASWTHPSRTGWVCPWILLVTSMASNKSHGRIHVLWTHPWQMSTKCGGCIRGFKSKPWTRPRALDASTGNFGEMPWMRPEGEMKRCGRTHGRVDASTANWWRHPGVGLDATRTGGGCVHCNGMDASNGTKSQ